MFSIQLCTLADNIKDINLKAARTEFCGPEKRISQETMDQYDRDIAAAERSKDKARKKELKLR